MLILLLLSYNSIGEKIVENTPKHKVMIYLGKQINAHLKDNLVIKGDREYIFNLKLSVPLFAFSEQHLNMTSRQS